MVALPRDRTLYYLAVNACVTSQLAGIHPVFKIEELAEKAEHALLVEKFEADGAAQIPGKKRSCLLQFG